MRARTHGVLSFVSRLWNHVKHSRTTSITSLALTLPASLIGSRILSKYQGNCLIADGFTLVRRRGQDAIGCLVCCAVYGAAVCLLTSTSQARSIADSMAA